MRDTTVVNFPCLLTEQRILPVHLAFRGITVTVGDRTILQDVDGYVRPGEILAVMGPSGSGKTSLLNTLSGRLKPESGEIFLNREPLCKKWKRKICYVLQQDIFFPYLTLRQTLEFNARLRLPDTLSFSQKMECVDHIIDVLDLNACQHTIIGDGAKRGLSGGEKKRANIACELLTNPSLMLLDECTSGLDAHSALLLMEFVKRYAVQEGKTVVVTLHQPSSQIFHMCDKLLLINDGQTVYLGETSRVVDYFSAVGLNIMPNYNPADYVLEHMHGPPETKARLLNAAKLSRKNKDYPIELRHDYHYNEKYENSNKMLLASHEPYSTLKQDTLHAIEPDVRRIWMDSHSHASSSVSSETSDSDCYFSWPTSYWTQFTTLSERNFLEARPKMLSKLNWIQSLGLALIAGTIWFQMDRNEDAIRDIEGWIFFSNSYWMLYAHFQALHAFPTEHLVINKERMSGAYRLSAYFFAKMISELPVVITLPSVFFLIKYIMIGVVSVPVFFYHLGFLLLNVLVAQSVGLFIGACCMEIQTSVTISALYTIANQLFSGFLSTTIPPWLTWVRYTSMIHYAYQNMEYVEFELGIKCGAKTKYEICNNGGDIIPATTIVEGQGGALPLWANTLLLFGFLIIFRILTYLVLRYRSTTK